MGQTLEDMARQGHWGMDARALAWTLGTQDDDHQREQLMTGVPEFFSWKIPDVVDYPLDLRHQRVPGTSILPRALCNILTNLRHASYPAQLERKID
jgi:hypothetical protein